MSRGHPRPRSRRRSLSPFINFFFGAIPGIWPARTQALGAQAGTLPPIGSAPPGFVALLLGTRPPVLAENSASPPPSTLAPSLRLPPAAGYFLGLLQRSPTSPQPSPPPPRGSLSRLRENGTRGAGRAGSAGPGGGSSGPPQLSPAASGGPAPAEPAPKTPQSARQHQAAREALREKPSRRENDPKPDRSQTNESNRSPPYPPVPPPPPAAPQSPAEPRTAPSAPLPAVPLAAGSGSGRLLRGGPGAKRSGRQPPLSSPLPGHF